MTKRIKGCLFALSALLIITTFGHPLGPDEWIETGIELTDEEKETMNMFMDRDKDKPCDKIAKSARMRRQIPVDKEEAAAAYCCHVHPRADCESVRNPSAPTAPENPENEEKEQGKWVKRAEGITDLAGAKKFLGQLAEVLDSVNWAAAANSFPNSKKMDENNKAVAAALKDSGDNPTFNTVSVVFGKKCNKCLFSNQAGRRSDVKGKYVDQVDCGTLPPPSESEKIPEWFECLKKALDADPTFCKWKKTSETLKDGRIFSKTRGCKRNADLSVVLAP